MPHNPVWTQWIVFKYTFLTVLFFCSSLKILYLKISNNFTQFGAFAMLMEVDGGKKEEHLGIHASLKLIP